jgi:pimeloyl-ACP methyl ester carboxylesterase
MIDRTSGLQAVGLKGFDSHLTYRTVGEGSPLVVLHTFRGQLEYSDLIVPALASSYRVYQVDLPGHGRSTHDPDLPYRAGEFVSQLGSFLDLMELDGVVIVGESIGATIALALSSRNPDQVKQVFAFNPHDGGSLIGGTLGRIASWAGGLTTLIPKLESPLLALLLRAGYANPDNLDAGYVRLLRTTAAGEPNHARVMTSILRHQDTWAELRSLYPEIPGRLPVSLIYGDRNWGPSRLISSNAAAIPSVGEPIMLPHTGHFSFRDNPEAVLRVIRDHSR